MSQDLSLPPPIGELVAAVNRGDTAAFLALFADDALIDDWGRQFVGSAAIRAWSDTEFIGAKGRIEVLRVEIDGAVVTLDVDWRSTFYSGASRFVFEIDAGLVRAMRIPAR